MSGDKKEKPPWMTPEAGDEVGEQVAEELAAGDGGETTAGAAESAPSEEQVEPAEDDSDAEPAAEIDRVAELEAELAATKDRMLRVAADFENFRRRAKREQDDARVRGREEILGELLVVFDNLERAVDAAGAHANDEATKAIVDGVAMVEKQFADGLGRFGLKGFASLGRTFDPNFHEAVAQMASDEYAPGVVIQEYQKGYMLGERLLRAAMVVVSTPDSTGTKKIGDDEADDAGAGAAEEGGGATEQTAEGEEGPA